MILTPHALVGAAITNSLPSHPGLGALGAFISHFVLDLIPHLDYDLSGLLDEDTKTVRSAFRHVKALLNLVKIAFDFFLGMFLAILIFARDERTLLLTILGVLAGTLPDLLQFVHLKLQHPCTNSLQCAQEFLHTENKMKDRPVLGVLVQVLVPLIVLALYFILQSEIL